MGPSQAQVGHRGGHEPSLGPSQAQVAQVGHGRPSLVSCGAWDLPHLPQMPTRKAFCGGHSRRFACLARLAVGGSGGREKQKKQNMCVGCLTSSEEDLRRTKG